MSNYLPGKIVKKAATTKRIGLILPILNVLVGVLVALPISIPIEEARLSAICEAPFQLAFAIAVLAVAARCLVEKWYVGRVNNHGSFLYVSALYEQQNDRDKYRLERVMERTAIEVKGASIPPFNLLKPVEIDLKETPTPAEAFRTLNENLQFALKADDPKLPTHFLLNLLWPMAIKLGIHARLRGEKVTLWYIKNEEVEPAKWLKYYKWLDNTLLDTIDLPSLVAQYPDPTSAKIKIAQPNKKNSGNSILPIASEAVMLELSGSPIPDRDSELAFKDVYNNATRKWRVRPANEPANEPGNEPGNESESGSLTDPVDFAYDSVRAAAAIFRAVKAASEQETRGETQSKIVQVFGRVAKPQAFAIGHMLRSWVPNERDREQLYANIEFYNWQQGKYVPWKFDG